MMWPVAQSLRVAKQAAQRRLVRSFEVCYLEPVRKALMSSKSFIIVVVAALAQAASGCGDRRSQPATPPAAQASTPSALAHQMVDQGALLLDVRTPEEYAAGHLPNAVNIPVGELSGRIAEVGDHDRGVVVYCAHGTRAAKAKDTLTAAGFTKVHSLGGMSAW